MNDNEIKIVLDETPQDQITVDAMSLPDALRIGGELHTDPHVVFVNPPATTSIPNQRTATIGDMLSWSAQMNGKVTKGRKAAIINYCLINIAELQPLAAIPWQSRKWALPAWREIQRIGILDSLCILPPEKPRAIGDDTKYPVARVKQLCELLELGFNKINGRIVITRKAYTAKSKVKCQADA